MKVFINIIFFYKNSLFSYLKVEVDKNVGAYQVNTEKPAKSAEAVKNVPHISVSVKNLGVKELVK